MVAVVRLEVGVKEHVCCKIVIRNFIRPFLKTDVLYRVSKQAVLQLLFGFRVKESMNVEETLQFLVYKKSTRGAIWQIPHCTSENKVLDI